MTWANLETDILEEFGTRSPYATDGDLYDDMRGFRVVGNCTVARAKNEANGYATRRSRGLCGLCGGETVPGLATCAAHRARPGYEAPSRLARRARHRGERRQGKHEDAATAALRATRIVAMRAAGLSMTAIGRELGIDRTTVRHYLKTRTQ